METRSQVVEGRSYPFSRAIETTVLVDRIKRMSVGELIRYRELNELIGQDVQAEARHILHSARHICLREYKIVTDPLNNIGIRRATDVELTNSGLGIFGRMRRMARRGVDRVMAVADWDALPDAEKVRANATVSALKLMEVIGKPRSVDRIAGAVNTEMTGQLPIARTLELFGGKKV
jgi:hypothetical protein